MCRSLSELSLENKGIPYIKVVQNEMAFVLMSLPISFLKRKVNFHFRSPFKKGTTDFMNAVDYVGKMQRTYGLSISNEEHGLQRRTNIKRIKEISNYAQEANGIVFPTPIILSLNVFNEEGRVLKQELEEQYFNKSFGQIEYDSFEKMEFTIIDGQHRLAGLVDSFNKTSVDLEMPVTLVLGAGLSEATEIFIQINGNQRKVDRSMIYDLYENIHREDFENINKFVRVSKALNERENSPFFGMIKRLGTGSGTISQAFLIDNIINIFSELELINRSVQDIYSYLFLYFSIVKEVFSEKWKNNGRHSSQLVKTNGIGALFLIMIQLNKQFGSILEPQNQINYIKFFEERNKFDWDSKLWSGTGNKIQKTISIAFLENKS